MAYDVTLMYFVELGFVIMLTVLSGFTSHRPNQKSISGIMFKSLYDMLPDAIFILNQEGHIIFRNQSSKHDDYTVDSIVQLDSLTSVFNHKVSVIRSRADMIEVKVLDDYFFLQIKPIMEDGMLKAHLISVSKVTELMAMINTLKDKEHEANQLNKKLMHYSQIVYDVEKEMNIQNILNKVMDIEGKRINQLLAMLETLKDNPHNIGRAIELNKKILEEIRSAVGAYRTYFGGTYD
jgi:hypothetical protein